MGIPNGDIKLSSNFELNVSKPLDAREVVTNFSDLSTISFKYAGMIVFVSALNTHYTLLDDLITWTLITGGGGGSVNTTNGLYLSSGYLGLGGNLGHTTTIDLKNNYFYLNQNGNQLISFSEKIINDSSGQTSINWQGRYLYDSNSLLSVYYDTRQLVDTTGNTSIDWNNRKLHQSDGYVSVDYQNLLLNDSSGNLSIDWNNRYLSDTNGDMIVSWDTDNLVVGNGTPIILTSAFNNIIHNASSVTMGSHAVYNVIFNNPQGVIFYDHSNYNFCGGSINASFAHDTTSNFIFAQGGGITFKPFAQGNFIAGIASGDSITGEGNVIMGFSGGNTFSSSGNANTLIGQNSGNTFVGSGNALIGEGNGNSIFSIGSFMAGGISGNTIQGANNILLGNMGNNFVHNDFNILLGEGGGNHFYGNGNINAGVANSNYYNGVANVSLGNVNGNTYNSSSSVVLGFGSSNNINGNGNSLIGSIFGNTINSQNNILLNATTSEIIGQNNILLNASNAIISINKTTNVFVNPNKDFTDHNIKADSFILEKYTMYNSASTAWLDITVDTLSSDREITFPDKSGTIALLSDISGGGSIITLSGDVSGSGTSGITTVIGSNKVLYSKIQQVSGKTILGNPSGLLNNVTELALTSGLALSGNTIGIINQGVTYSKIQNITANRLLGRVNSNGVVEEIQATSGLSFSGLTLGLSNSGVVAGSYNHFIVNSKGIITFASNSGSTLITLSGDVTGSGTAGLVTTIGSNKVSYSKIQQVSGKKILGNPSGLLNNVTELALTSGLALSGNTIGIITNGITNSMIRQSVANSVIGNSSNSSGNISDIISSSDGQVLQRINGKLQFVQNYNIVTLTQIRTLISSGSIIIGANYLITNPSLGGKILLNGSSTSGLNPEGIWLRPTTLYPFGCISLRSGTAGGYITNIKVNGVAINGAKVNFNTSINTTTTNLATNINAHSSSTGFSAVAINNYLIVKSTTATASLNGQVVSGSSGGITLGNALPLAHGQNPYVMKLSCIYDPIGDAFNMVSDTNIGSTTNYGGNVFITSAASNSSLTQFSWGDNRFFDNVFTEASSISNIFLYGANSFFGYNHLSGASSIGNNFIYSNTTFSEFYVNTLTSNATISNNVIYSTVTNQTPLLGYNVLNTLSSISNNVIEASGSAIVSISYNTLTNNGQINSNIVTVSSGYTSINHNNLAGGFAKINSNIWTTPANIAYNNLWGLNSQINSNIFQTATNDSNITSTFSIYSNQIYDCGSITSNVFSGAQTTIRHNTIYSNTFSANASGITSCLLSGSNNSINKCTIDSSFITAINFNSVANLTLSNINILKNGQTWGTFTMDRSYSGILWNIDDTYSITSSVTFTGATNLGQSGSDVSLSYVPTKFYATEAYIEGSNIVGASANIVLGIQVDNTTGILGSTLATTLNSNITKSSPSFTKTTAFRKVVATPSTANITAGTLKLILKGLIGI